jgi:hypothetical protein
VKHEDAESSVRHFERVSALSVRLAVLGVAIYEHSWHSLVFGSWVLVAGSRHRRFRFCWDGREFFIDVSRSEHPSGGIRAQWIPVTNDRLPSGAPSAPIQYVENFFQQNRNA